MENNQDTYTERESSIYVNGIRKGTRDAEEKIAGLQKELDEAKSQLAASAATPSAQSSLGSQQPQDFNTEVVNALDKLNKKVDSLSATQQAQTQSAERLNEVEALFENSANKNDVMKHVRDIVKDEKYANLPSDDIAALAQSRVQGDTFEGTSPQGDVAPESQTDTGQPSVDDMVKMDDKEFAKIEAENQQKMREAARENQ